MAKIYETRTDFERDKLKDQANRLHNRAHTENSVGMLFLLGGLAAEFWNDMKKIPHKALSVLSATFYIAAAVEWIMSWSTRRRARDLDLQRERLGPEQVTLPPEMASQQQQECKPCAIKEVLTAGSRSPRDFAETPASPDPAIKR